MHNLTGHFFAGLTEMAGRGRKRFSDSPSSSSVKKAKGRQFLKSGFEKWQRDNEKEHKTLTWLRYNMDSDRAHVASLFCCVCRKYEKNISSLKNFSSAWVLGSTNLRLSNMLDHARSEVHKLAMSRLMADSAKERGLSIVQSTPIGRSLHTMDETTLGRLKIKFDVCYTLAKQSLPFSKYPALLELESSWV